ncbi:MAG TPA: BTAD domain-containing putative transcriptional regulator [Ktedonosporobacter sp.]|nr:BTAD domain-containing putative transcriptional regulator [Ktedonosporobacter sp.]
MTAALHLPPAAGQLTIHLLGSPEVWVGGIPLILHNQKARALLYYLAATGQSHVRDHLAALLWSESPDSNARHSLRSSLYSIRQALHNHAVDDLLTSNADRVKLEPLVCDVPRFRRLLEDNHKHALTEAVALYRGPLLQGFSPSEAPLFEAWARFERAALQQLYVTAQLRLAEQAEQRQAWDEAIASVLHLIHLDPLSEEAQQRLIRLYVRKGAMSQAVRQYYQFEAELRHELGLTPAPETQALVAVPLIARRADSLHLPLQVTSPGTLHRFLSPDPPQSPSFIGREPLLKDLLALSQEANAGRAAIFLHQLYEQLAPTASAHDLLDLTCALGQVHQSLGQMDEAVTWHRQYLELACALSDAQAQRTAHFELGELALVANNYQAALAAAQAGLAVSLPGRHEQHLALEARGHRLFGAALAMEGRDLSAAELHLQEAVAAHRLTDNPHDLCAALFELGNVAAQRGELRRALSLYEEAAHAAEGAHVHYFLALAYNNLAYHRLLLGELDAARQALAKGLTLAETYEMFGAMLHLSSTQGEIYLYTGNWAAASQAFHHGLALAEELGNLERQAGYRAGLALVARGQNNLEDATVLLEEALGLLIDRGYWHLWVRIQLWLADVLLLRGYPTQAEPHLNAGMMLAREHGRMLLLAQAERLQASLLASYTRWQEAEALFASSLERLTSLNLSLECARTKAVWGKAEQIHHPLSSTGSIMLAEACQLLATYGAQADLQTLSCQLSKHDK